MKTLQKVLVILIMAVCVFGVMPNNISMAASQDASAVIDGVSASNPDSKYTQKLQGIIGNLLGFLQVASGLFAILMIAITGFNYIISTPEVKDEMKKKMLPIIIGLVLVFGATSLAKFILGVVGG